jgi:hypothetical protein
MFVQQNLLLVVVGLLFLCCGEPALLGNWALWGTSYHFWVKPPKHFGGTKVGEHLWEQVGVYHMTNLIIRLPKMGPFGSRSDQISLVGKVGNLKVFFILLTSESFIYLFMTIYVLRLRNSTTTKFINGVSEMSSTSFLELDIGAWAGGMKKNTQATSIGIAPGTSLGTYFNTDFQNVTIETVNVANFGQNTSPL